MIFAQRVGGSVVVCNEFDVGFLLGAAGLVWVWCKFGVGLTQGF